MVERFENAGGDDTAVALEAEAIDCVVGAIPWIKCKIEGTVAIDAGDVIAAEMSWDYGSGKYEVVDGKPRFSVSPNIIRLDAGVRAHIKALAKNAAKLAEIRSSWPAERPRESLEVRIGPVASGAAVIANADKVREIEGQHRKLVGIDMEAYSLFEAANEATAPRPTAVCIKGVSDFADSEKSDNFQGYAAYTCAEVFRVLVEEYLFR